MDIGVEIMKKRNKKLTELLEQRRALCDKMTHGVPGCSTDCKLFALRAARYYPEFDEFEPVRTEVQR